MRESKAILMDQISAERGRLTSYIGLGSAQNLRGIQIPLLPVQANQDDTEYQIHTGTTTQNVFIEGYSHPDGPDVVV